MDQVAKTLKTEESGEYTGDQVAKKIVGKQPGEDTSVDPVAKKPNEGDSVEAIS